MSIRIFLNHCFIFIVLFSAYSCGNNPKPEENKETIELDDSLTIPEPAMDTAEMTGKDNDELTEEKPEKNKIPDGPPPNYSSLPGPVGFVNEANLILREKPNANANKIATLKKKETVYILETSMIGGDGAQTQYPTWYRIETKNKERGWVKASAVSSGH